MEVVWGRNIISAAAAVGSTPPCCRRAPERKRQGRLLPPCPSRCPTASPNFPAAQISLSRREPEIRWESFELLSRLHLNAALGAFHLAASHGPFRGHLLAASGADALRGLSPGRRGLCKTATAAITIHAMSFHGHNESPFELIYTGLGSRGTRSGQAAPAVGLARYPVEQGNYL
jgi:hypothetical protein